MNYSAIMELRSSNKIGEALLTGSQRMATRVTSNPSYVIPNVSRTGDSTDGIGSAIVGSTDLTKDHSAFGESATNLSNSSSDISSNYKTHNIDDVAKLFGVPLNSSTDIEELVQDLYKVSPSDLIVRSVDINAKSTSYAGAMGVSAKDQPKSNFCPLVADPVFNGVNISIPRKVVEKKQLGETWAEKDYDEFQRFLKEELTRILIWVKLHDVPIQVFEEDGISLIATFIGKPIMLDSYTSSMCNDSWGRSSFARCLIKVDLEANLIDVVTIGVPSLTRDDFTKETIRVEYERRPPRCDLCKIFGHVHNHCPKKVASHPIVATSYVTPTVVKINDGPSVKVRYEPKATTSEPKMGATNVGNASKLSSMLKSTGTPSKEGNITTSNSYSAFKDNEEDDEEHVENVYDESANLFPNSKAGEISSFMAAAG
ncbi:zinc knuckle CX2CX4HX4C containing protein [Tanacetum coccineum]